MKRYQIDFDVCRYISLVNQTLGWEAATVTLELTGYDANDALSRVKSILVSADGMTANHTGDVGHNGRCYPEWSVRAIRRVQQ